MNFTRNEALERSAAAAGGSAASAYTVDLLVRCVAECTPPKPLADPSTVSWHASDGAEIVTLPLVAIAAFTQARLKVLKDLRSLEQRRRMMDLLQECCRRCEGGQLFPDLEISNPKPLTICLQVRGRAAAAARPCSQHGHQRRGIQKVAASG